MEHHWVVGEVKTALDSLWERTAETLGKCQNSCESLPSSKP